MNETAKAIELQAFAVWHKDTPEHETIINEKSASAARYDYYLDLSDCWSECRYIDIRSRKIGRPVTTDNIARIAEYRDKPFAKGGMKVKVGDNFGLIVGGNSSANWDVLFTTGPRTGVTMNCHPDWQMTYYDDNGDVIYDTRESKK